MRSMARPLRIQYPDAWYHVMNRGRRGEPVFPDDAARKGFIRLLRETGEMWHMRVSAYCLMGNHYHLLVQTPRANLSRCMRHIDGVYTQRINKRLEWDGPVFRGRYKAVLIDKDSYLLEVLRYIHRNPVRAGLSKTPDGYSWTSHRGYLSQATEWDWLHKDALLSTLERSPSRRRSAYVGFVSTPDTKALVQFYSAQRLKPVLGAAAFLQWVKDTFIEPMRHAEVASTDAGDPTIDGVLAATAAAYRTKPESLLESRRGRANEPRNVAMLLSWTETGEGMEGIAAAFGLRNARSIAGTVHRLKSRMASDGPLRDRVERARRNLAKLM